MNAAVVTAFDAPPHYTTFADPEPQPGEHLVRVRAAGLHQIVKSIANGSHYMSSGKLPFIPGVDCVGTLADGSRVYTGGARFPYGTFCEQTVVSGFFNVPLPDALDDAFAAAVANPAMSSWAALDRARFTAGATVLILGATGTSGQLAVQIAKHRGAGRVIATGRNPQALASLKDLGADAIVSLDQDREALVQSLRGELAEKGVDVVLDYLYGAPAEATLAAIAQKGAVKPGQRVRYVQIGNLAGASIALEAHTLRSTNVEILGSGFGSASMEELLKGIAAFFDLCTREKFAFQYRAEPLSAVEKLWNEKEQATRLVFVP